MFKRILGYAGEYRKITYAAVIAMLAGMVAQVLPFWFIYQIIRPVLMREPMTAEYVIWRIAAIAACTVLYAVLYIWGALPLPQRGVQHAEKPAHLPARKAGGPASGRHSGKGCRRHQKDVHQRH